ncbi:hypothetical protein BJY00DRAFT_297335 [Aspergillus carlsbadensis]|nr:hypothetical protein BJY00DRAFT_297335 [Aspergillus carlsbadensis]
MAFIRSRSVSSLPLSPWQLKSRHRVAKSESRKRKKEYETGEDEDDTHNGDDGWTTDAVSEFGTTAPPAILPPEEAHQYRVAGLGFDEELPGGHFPHGPAKAKSRGVNNRRSTRTQPSSLPRHEHIPQSAANQGNLRHQHLAVLTSILDRCLGNGDYIRAGRAWGLLIREHFGGRPIDIRIGGRWGIGAEILLRQGQQKSNEPSETDREAVLSILLREGQQEPTEPPESHREAHKRTEEPDELLFTRKGFENAKLYYETLVIQHPYQKTMPNATSALDFYPVMFGLWIYVTQEESAHARRNLDKGDSKSSGETSDEEDDQSDPDHHYYRSVRHQSMVASIRANELVEAQKIAARIDEIIVSPPYSDSPELLELRSMVSLWIADLFVSSLASGGKNGGALEDQNIREDDSDGDDVFMSTETKHDSVQARRDRRLAMEKKQMEMEKSQEFLEWARLRKQGVASKLEDLHIDTDDDDDISLHSIEPY